MKQHPVPENIMDVEFKLFGSLTAKQFGYIIAGGLCGLFFFYAFKSLGSTFLGWIFAFLCVVLGISLALIRINEQPFEVWMGNFIAAMFSSQKRVWKKEKKVPKALDKKKVVSTPQVQKMQDIQPAQQADTPVQPKPQTSIPAHPFKDISQKEGVSMQQTPPQPMDNENTNQGVFIPGSAQGYVSMSTNQQQNRPLNIPQSTGSSQVPDVKSQTSSIQQQDQKSQDVQKPTVQQPANTQKFFINKPKEVTPTTPSPQQSGVGTQNQQITQTGQVASKPQTQSKVPLSSVPVPQVSSVGAAGAAAQKSVHQNKASTFTDIVPNKTQVITQAYSPQPKVGDQTPTPTQVKSNIDFNEENKALRGKVADVTADKDRIEKELSRVKDSYNMLQSQNEQILNELQKMKKQIGPDAQQAVPQKEVAEEINLLSPKVYNGPSLARKPNVLSGIVKSKDGKLLPGVVVIVKNDKSRPVRAMKTNSLGQFMTTTPLENGIYTVELTKDNFSFRIYEVTLNGDLLPSYEFIGD